jgi:hypothetical protein
VLLLKLNVYNEMSQITIIRTVSITLILSCEKISNLLCLKCCLIFDLFFVVLCSLTKVSYDLIYFLTPELQKVTTMS